MIKISEDYRFNRIFLYVIRFHRYVLVPIDFMGHRYTGDTDDPEILNINRKKALEWGTAIGNGHRTELAFITVHRPRGQSYIHSKK